MAAAPTARTKTSNGKGAKAAAEAALAELEDTPRISHFRGVALTLPPKLSATFALDMAEIQAGQGTNDLGGIYRLMVGLVGVDQWRAMREKILQDGDSMDEVGDLLSEMIQAVTEPYGVEPGESPASANS